VTLLANGPAGHSPVQRAGLVLLALTPDPQLPMQLRLLILEEVSPRPRLTSLQDLHRELEFFERPDRQGSCARCMNGSIKNRPWRDGAHAITRAAAEAASSVVEAQWPLGSGLGRCRGDGGCHRNIGLAAA